MLTDTQLQCIELLAEGTLTKADISKQLNISDRVVYKWQKDEEFKKEQKKRAEDFQVIIKMEGKARMCAKGQIAVDNIFKIANTAESEKTKLDANIFIYEVIFGKATTKIEQTTETTTGDRATEEDILAAVERVKNKENTDKQV